MNQPNQWFIPPLKVIQQIVKLLVSEQIMNYNHTK